MNKEYLIKEKPLKALLVFAIPMIIGNLFQQFYTMVDSVVVGRFVNENALAAVGASHSLTAVFISVAIGGGIGASVITSRYFGARDYRRMKTSIRTALVSFFVISVALGVAGLFCAKQIMIWLNTPSNVLEQATEYLNIYFLGLPFLFMYNVLAAMFNALGKSRIPLYLLVFSSVLNIVLDLFMVCVLELEVAGVAWATLIAQGISAVCAFVIFAVQLRRYHEKETEQEERAAESESAIARVARKRVIFDKREFANMARVACPSILQQSTVSVGMMLVQSVVNSFGSEVLAGFSASMRVEGICVVPMAAMGNAISSYTAQNIGAGKFDRVREGYRKGYGIVFAFAIVLCLWLEIWYRPLVKLFLGEEGTVLAMQTGTEYLRFIGWFFALIGLKMLTDGVLRGAGDMTMFTVANMVNLGLRVVMAVTLAPRFGVAMVWIAVPIGWLANYIISFAQYKTGKWLKKNL